MVSAHGPVLGPGQAGLAGPPRLPYSFPPLRARIVVALLRAFLLVLSVGGVYLFAFHDVSWLFLHTTAGPISAWVAAVIAWAAFAGLVLADVRAVRATEAGVTVRTGSTRTDYPWSSLAEVARTTTHLVLVTRDGARREVEIVSKEMRGNMTPSTSPTARLAADLEQLRRLAPTSRGVEGEITERREAPPGSALLFLVVAAVLMGGIAALGTAVALV